MLHVGKEFLELLYLEDSQTTPISLVDSGIVDGVKSPWHK